MKPKSDQEREICLFTSFSTHLHFIKQCLLLEQNRTEQNSTAEAISNRILKLTSYPSLHDPSLNPTKDPKLSFYHFPLMHVSLRLFSHLSPSPSPPSPSSSPSSASSLAQKARRTTRAREAKKATKATKASKASKAPSKKKVKWPTRPIPQLRDLPRLHTR